MKIDEQKHLKDRTNCKSCCNIQRKKNNDNTFLQNQQPKIDNVNTNNNNITLIIKLLNCGETYLMDCILLQKREPIFVMTKSLNQYPNVKAQTSDKSQQLANYENNAVVFEDMLYTKRASNNDLFLTREKQQNMIYTTYLKAIFVSLKKLTVLILIELFYLNKLQRISFFY